MGNSKVQFWFRAEGKDDTSVAYLVSAETTVDARLKFGLFSQGVNIRAMTWGQMQKLTGCEIPEGCEVTNFAKGSLVFRRGGFRWLICTGEGVGG